MPWELTIRRDDGQPLGNREVVKDVIAEVFVGVKFYWDASGSERLAAATKQGLEFPEVIRKLYESRPAMERGEYVGAEYAGEFYFSNDEMLQEVHVDLRGHTQQAMYLLRQLADRTNWDIFDHTDQENLFS